jgi:hypothetical protein
MIGPSVHLVRLLDTGVPRSVASVAVPAGCSSATRDQESSASAEIETGRGRASLRSRFPSECVFKGRFYSRRGSKGWRGLAARGNTRPAMLRHDGGIQQTPDSLVELTVAHYHLCRAGSSLARIALRASRTPRSKGAIWLTILFLRNLSFQRKGKNCNVRTATPKHSISGPICGMTRNDWPRKRNWKRAG